MSYDEETFRKLATQAAEMKFRILIQGDISAMIAVSLLKNDASASQISLLMTMARGKMVSLSQIQPVLKELVDWNCLKTRESMSDQTGRPMTCYSLTLKGEQVLESSIELMNLLVKSHKKK